MAEELLELVEELRAVVAELREAVEELRELVEERELLSTCGLVTVAELREEEPGLT